MLSPAVRRHARRFEVGDRRRAAAVLVQAHARGASVRSKLARIGAERGWRSLRHAQAVHSALVASGTAELHLHHEPEDGGDAAGGGDASAGAAGSASAAPASAEETATAAAAAVKNGRGSAAQP